MSESLSDPSLTYHSYTRGDYTISTDPAHLDADAIADYLARSYWANLRPRAIIELSLRHSLNFGLYYTSAEAGNRNKTQVGLARVVTDYATYAYLCDVYLLEEHRGHGLGKWLIETLIHDPALQYPRRITLATRDAHGLYAQFGFTPLTKPENRMERAHNP
jgi:GNAT superfamily N-acetyltransferase